MVSDILTTLAEVINKVTNVQVIFPEVTNRINCYIKMCMWRQYTCTLESTFMKSQTAVN